MRGFDSSLFLGEFLSFHPSSQLSCYFFFFFFFFKIVERSIYGYKITHVKFEAVEIYTRPSRRDKPPGRSERQRALLARSNCFRVNLHLYFVSLGYVRNILNTSSRSIFPPLVLSFFFFFSSNRNVYNFHDREREREKNHDFDNREHAMGANIPLSER